MAHDEANRNRTKYKTQSPVTPKVDAKGDDGRLAQNASKYQPPTGTLTIFETANYKVSPVRLLSLRFSKFSAVSPPNSGRMAPEEFGGTIARARKKQTITYHVCLPLEISYGTIILLLNKTRMGTLVFIPCIPPNVCDAGPPRPHQLSGCQCYNNVQDVCLLLMGGVVHGNKGSGGIKTHVRGDCTQLDD